MFVICCDKFKDEKFINLIRKLYLEKNQIFFIIIKEYSTVTSAVAGLIAFLAFYSFPVSIEKDTVLCF